MSPAAAFATVLLWPSSTAEPWADTLNPVTRGPWRSREEYERFWRLPREERDRLIRESQASSSASTSTTAPTTGPSPQAGPQAAPRRHPDQTCENAVLDRLQSEKDRICNAIPGESCSEAKVSRKRLARRPCSQIRLRIQAMEECLNIRQRIQDECFGGRPDPVHEAAMRDIRNGIEHCRALEAVNCAPGHPMADL